MKKAFTARTFRRSPGQVLAKGVQGVADTAGALFMTNIAAAQGALPIKVGDDVTIGAIRGFRARRAAPMMKPALLPASTRFRRNSNGQAKLPRTHPFTQIPPPTTADSSGRTSHDLNCTPARRNVARGICACGPPARRPTCRPLGLDAPHRDGDGANRGPDVHRAGQQGVGACGRSQRRGAGRHAGRRRQPGTRWKTPCARPSRPACKRRPVGLFATAVKDNPTSGALHLGNQIPAQGALPIKVGDDVIGAITSGSPGGDKDEACAKVTHRQGGGPSSK